MKALLEKDLGEKRKMRKQFILIALLLIFSIFLISEVSAEIWFTSQPKPLYNIGDNLEISISVSQAGEQIKVELVCGSESKIFFVKYLVNETTVSIFQPLTKSFLWNMKGNCKITVLSRQEEAESSSFVISNSVFLRLGTDNLNYNPGESVNIEGEAEKENSQLLNGFFELDFEEVGIFVGTINNGKFQSNFTLPENIAAGSYLIKIKAYEKEGEEITNAGEKQASINVKQMPKKIDIALNNQNVKPGNNLNFKIILLDQSGNTINGDVSYLIEDSEENSLSKSLIKTDKDETFFIEKNLSPGYYKIKASSSNIYSERQFYVEENEEVEFKIVNGTLIVRNIGNIKYNKAVQVKINDIVEIINPELDVGEEKKYRLEAPDGEYSVLITDGTNSLSNEGTALTGGAISVKEAGGTFLRKGKNLAWIFIILVLGMFIFVASRRTLKKKFVLSEPGSLGSEGARGGVIKVGKANEKLVMQKDIREAEHSVVIRGQKQNAALMCIKIKNEIGNASKENLKKVLEKSYENKAAVYKSGNYAIAIFSPLITKTFKNYVPAVKTALDIARALQENNRKFEEKIDFGMSVHSGDIVNRLQENKLLFTSLGNATLLAKKIADISDGEVLLSKEIHERTLSEIKTDKKEKAGLEVFTINRLTDTERNKNFIQDFLKRQEEEKRDLKNP